MALSRRAEEIDGPIFDSLLRFSDDSPPFYWTSYVGQGAVRFVLSYDVQPASPNFGQVVILTKNIQARDRLKKKLQALIAKDFIGTDAFVHLLDIGLDAEFRDAQGRPYRICRGTPIQMARIVLIVQVISVSRIENWM